MKFLCSLFLLLSFAATASAVEPEHAKAIEELLELSRTQEAYEASVIGSFEASIAATANQIPADQKPKFERAMDRVKALMLEKMGWKVIKPEIVDLYAATFSQTELEAILPLMRTPEMKTFVAKSAPLAAQASKLGGAKAQALQGEIMKIVQEEMQP